MTNRFNPLTPGEYSSNMLPVELHLTTTTELNVLQAERGKIEIAALDTGDDYFGVGFFEVDTLVLGDADGRQIERIPASTELDDFLGRLSGSSLVDSGSGTLGGLPGSWWRISWTDGDCCWEPLFQTPGWSNLWGNPAGFDQTIWAIDAADTTIFVIIEAPTAAFDAWTTTVDDTIFAGLDFGEPTGNTTASPAGLPYGPHRVGRLETSVTDTSRSVEEILGDDGRIVVPAAVERKLLLSIVYPSSSGGHRGSVLDGSYPLVISAHALRDHGLTLPAEHLLASHGYVVVTIRFPESSFPGMSPQGILEQPTDVSFVIDQILDGALGPELTATIDVDSIGVVGASGGATTVFGLTASDCCVDERISAAIAHAGPMYDFDTGEREPPSTAGRVPILHVASNGDQVAPVDPIRQLHESWNGESTLAILENSGHLRWLDPLSAHFPSSASIVTAFFDAHLQGDPPGSGDVPDSFVEFDERNR